MTLREFMKEWGVALLCFSAIVYAVRVSWVAEQAIERQAITMKAVAEDVMTIRRVVARLALGNDNEAVLDLLSSENARTGVQFFQTGSFQEAMRTWRRTPQDMEVRFTLEAARADLQKRLADPSLTPAAREEITAALRISSESGFEDLPLGPYRPEGSRN